jgi:hypothetical protein
MERTMLLNVSVHGGILYDNLFSESMVINEVKAMITLRTKFYNLIVDSDII